MKKVILLTLIFAVVSAGVVFAQAEQPEQAEQVGQAGQAGADGFSLMPKNVITIDLAPTIAGLSFGATSSIFESLGDAFGLGELKSIADFDTKGFGIGVQYERQLMEKMSVAGRFAYMSMGTGLKLGSDLGKTNIDISSLSIEAHIRYFFDETMFVDGMLGYANMTAKFGYEGTDPVKTITDPTNSVAKGGFDVTKDYFKLGVKLGWRIDFGEPGGFVFEPSFGWSFGIGTGDSIVKKAISSMGKDIDDSTDKMLTWLTWGIDNLIFVGGPRLTLAVGYRF